MSNSAIQTLKTQNPKTLKIHYLKMSNPKAYITKQTLECYNLGTHTAQTKIGQLIVHLKFCVFIPSLADIADTLKLGMRWKTRDRTRVHTGDESMDNSNALQVFPCWNLFKLAIPLWYKHHSLFKHKSGKVSCCWVLVNSHYLCCSHLWGLVLY